MKEWASGKGDAPARVDPKLAAVAVTLANILVTLGVHQQVGLSEGDVLSLMLDVACIVTVLRSFQLVVVHRRSAKGSQEDASG